VITNRTRVDVLANSELRVCHYQTARFLTVKGPARIIVSVDGINVEAGKAVVSRDTCGLVEASAHQGGLVGGVTRGRASLHPRLRAGALRA
jgi:hypothetical protein